MRYLMMSLSVLMMLSSQDLFASAKTDSIVTFLGGAQAKFVWQKWAWCNENYAPKTRAAAVAEGWSLELMDTRTGTQRTLATGLKGAFLVRMSHMGTFATYIEGDTTYIVDLNSASPTKKVLMCKSDCSYWAVGTFWVDPANGTEYVYCEDNPVFAPINQIIGDCNGIYKVKLNSNGTVDRTTATKLTINSNSRIDLDISVSADGKKLGGAFPWPDTYILDIPTGRLDQRHNPGSGFGCQPCLAPDNSYRFYHCHDDHLGFYMFEANMVATDWFFNPQVNLGMYGANDQATFLTPRWTNHVQYYTCTVPMDDGAGNLKPYCINSFNAMDTYLYSIDGIDLFTENAAWVQNQIDMKSLTKFYLGKFSPDFKTQEKTIYIASDPRYIQGRGDAWICNGTTYGSQCLPPVSTSPAIRGERHPGLSVMRSGAFVNVHADAAATVRVTDTRGRIVRMWSGTQDRGLDTRALGTGTYLVSVTTGQRSASIRLPVTGVSH